MLLPDPCSSGSAGLGGPLTAEEIDEAFNPLDFQPSASGPSVGQGAGS
jgi:hypothetical protein